MKYLIVVAVLFFAAASAAPANSSSKIVGGYYASQGDFPYVASLKTSDLKLYCAGSILSQYWVLSTASCYSSSVAYVGVGSNYFPGQTHYSIYYFVQHSYYSPSSLLYDIMLVKTIRPMSYSYGYVMPISINYYPSNDNVLWTRMLLSGWGQTTAGTRNPYATTNYLQYVFFDMQSPSTCAAYNTQGGTGLPYNSNIQICAKGQMTYQSNTGACYGDAGSPLVYNNVQFGITSRGMYSYYGNPVCAVGFPDVFTRVSVFSSWISYVMLLY